MLRMHVGSKNMQLIYCFFIKLCDSNDRTWRSGSRRWLLRWLPIFLLSAEPYVIFEVHPASCPVGAVGSFLVVKVIDWLSWISHFHAPLSLRMHSYITFSHYVIRAWCLIKPKYKFRFYCADTFLAKFCCSNSEAEKILKQNLNSSYTYRNLGQ